MTFQKIKGSIFLFITAFIWGTTFVAQSISSDSVESFTFNGLRMLIGFVSLIPVLIIRGKGKISNLVPTKEIKKKTLVGGVICGIVLCFASYFQQLGLTLGTSAGKSGFISATYVILVPIVSFLFLRKKTAPYVWFCAVCATVGLYFLCAADFSGGIESLLKSFEISFGDIMTFVSAMLYTCHILVIEKYSDGTDGVFISAIQFFVAGTISVIGMLIFENPSLPMILEAKYGILYAGIFSSGIAYTFQILGQKTTPPAAASLIMCLESVFAVISDAIILKNIMREEEIIGASLMFISIIFSTVAGFEKKSKQKIKE